MPSGLKSLGARMPASGWASPKRSSASSAPGRSRVSGFSTRIQSAVEARMPWFTPREKPAFSVFSNSVTPGKSASAGAAFRRRELSTTTISEIAPAPFSSRERRHPASRSGVS